MINFLRYTTLRFAMLIGVGAVAYLFGLRSIALLVVAFLGSGILSFVLLNRQREAMGESVGGVLSRINARIDANSRSEDFDDEEQPPAAQ